MCIMASFAAAAIMHRVDLKRAWEATAAGKAGEPFPDPDGEGTESEVEQADGSQAASGSAGAQNEGD